MVTIVTDLFNTPLLAFLVGEIKVSLSKQVLHLVELGNPDEYREWPCTSTKTQCSTDRLSVWVPSSA